MVSVVVASAGLDPAALAAAAFLLAGLVVVSAVPAAEVHFEAERWERSVRRAEFDCPVVAAQHRQRQVIRHIGSTQASF
jgi:hypothetical protein